LYSSGAFSIKALIYRSGVSTVNGTPITIPFINNNYHTLSRAVNGTAFVLNLASNLFTQRSVSSITIKLNIMMATDTVLYTSTVVTTPIASTSTNYNIAFVDSTLTNSLSVPLVSANVNTVGSYVGYATYSTSDLTGVGG